MPRGLARSRLCRLTSIRGLRDGMNRKNDSEHQRDGRAKPACGLRIIDGRSFFHNEIIVENLFCSRWENGNFREGKLLRRMTMPLLVPFLVGIPVVIGGGWVIYHFVH